MDTENHTTDDLPTWRSTAIGYPGQGPLGPHTMQEAECVTKDALVTVRVRLQHSRVLIHATVTWGSHGVDLGVERHTRSVQERTWELPPRDEWGDTMVLAKFAALEWAATIDRSPTALSHRWAYTGQELADQYGRDRG